ncbi:hypothetical protein F4821DRAFT_94443 [Hypoxylon rubiginosum]|uniref:Uncharacterized protein n=1 Tax=Hypoxylon rubiginosum TaxID=110542 RepID=A0ACC0CIA0_9PEZI|nr:hypothetical protein F4821DRAFT_94443 [Hypoxylon rubiginosum]
MELNQSSVRMQTPNRFTYFYSLPKELRDHIWATAFQDPAVVPMRYRRGRLFATPHPLTRICTETRDLFFSRKPNWLMMGPDVITSMDSVSKLPANFDSDLFIIRVHCQDMIPLLQCSRTLQMEKLIITVSNNTDAPWSADDIPPGFESSFLQSWTTESNENSLKFCSGSDNRTLRMCILNQTSSFIQLLSYQSLLNIYGLSNWGPRIPAICFLQ